MSHGPVLWFAGGGTGGHLYPGLAIARAVARLAPGVRPHFIGAWRGIERDVLPGTEFPHTLLDLHPLYRRTPWDNWRTLRGALRAWRTLSAEVRASGKPVGVVGTGGYAAGVALGTASRVLNNFTEVDPDTRQRVLRTVDRLRYTPLRARKGHGARRDAPRRSPNIGLILLGMDDSLVSHILPMARSVGLWMARITTAPEGAPACCN